MYPVLMVSLDCPCLMCPVLTVSLDCPCLMFSVTLTSTLWLGIFVPIKIQKKLEKVQERALLFVYDDYTSSYITNLVNIYPVCFPNIC
jgi:hypothetical protein